MINQNHKIYLLAAGLVALTSCKEEAKSTAEVEEIAGTVLANMDTTLNPKSDFYNYVNGNCMKFTEILDDRTS
ncbi:hypothetical protein [Maribacter sp. ACAM166]|uniref:hypothetical protein n=1 Tax=Maribacter sp. ACAM166 TaxID=2508996 RepID=UPI0010FD8F75|nr:hypothetical protein [Maribacter sp. ACAM166]TLP82204.1 hypothetical protein ES765_01860 [Maribacter sp. ACAM166]